LKLITLNKKIKKMEFKNVAKQLKYLAPNGVTLNQDEKMNLMLSLAAL
jgi:hypothetical protein